MYLGDVWYTVDNKPIYEYCTPRSVSEKILCKLSSEIWSRRMLWCRDIRWQHLWVGRCSWRNAVRTNTDMTLKRKDKTWDMCSACRGKGHPWKAQIWNGKPFMVKSSREIKDWKNPDWCKSCSGSGEA